MIIFLWYRGGDNISLTNSFHECPGLVYVDIYEMNDQLYRTQSILINILISWVTESTFFYVSPRGFF